MMDALRLQSAQPLLEKLWADIQVQVQDENAGNQKESRCFSMLYKVMTLIQ